MMKFDDEIQVKEFEVKDKYEDEDECVVDV